MTVEPDARTELALTSHVDFIRETSVREPGGGVLEEDGLFLYAGPHPLPVLVNGAIRMKPDLAAGEVLDRARAFFGRGAAGSASTDSSVPTTTSSRLRTRREWSRSAIPPR